VWKDSNSEIPFLDVLVIRKVVKDDTGQYQLHIPTIHHMFTEQLPPYAKNIKVCVMKLVASDMIIS
jgi:hypothetical protein